MLCNYWLTSWASEHDWRIGPGSLVGSVGMQRCHETFGLGGNGQWTAHGGYLQKKNVGHWKLYSHHSPKVESKIHMRSWSGSSFAFKTNATTVSPPMPQIPSFLQPCPISPQSGNTTNWSTIVFFFHAIIYFWGKQVLNHHVVFSSWTLWEPMVPHTMVYQPWWHDCHPTAGPRHHCAEIVHWMPPGQQW